MLTPYDGLLFLVVVVGLAGRAWFGMRALRALTPDEAVRARPGLWARAIVTQWTLVGLLAVLWFARGRGFDWLGLAPRVTWGTAGVLLGLAFMAVMLAAQRRQLHERPELVARVRQRLAPVAALMPHSRSEWPGFVTLAVTAGVCEEILFRGFVTWVLAHLLPTFWMAALGQAILFGLAHAYQGPRGVLTTAAVGAFMAGLVWVSGSLWAAMLVHALMDLHAGDLALRVAVEPEPRAGVV